MTDMPSNLYQEIEEKKKQLRILILGPYKPKKAKKKLLDLKDCLRKDTSKQIDNQE